MTPPPGAASFTACPSPDLLVFRIVAVAVRPGMETNLWICVVSVGRLTPHVVLTLHSQAPSFGERVALLKSPGSTQAILIAGVKAQQ